MIFINQNSTLGSKNFTVELADAIRQDVKMCLSDDKLDDFELGLMQNMLHFGNLTADEFNFLFDVISEKTNLDKNWQKTLLEQMKSDERFGAKI